MYTVHCTTLANTPTTQTFETFDGMLAALPHLAEYHLEINKVQCSAGLLTPQGQERVDKAIAAGRKARFVVGVKSRG